MKKLLLLPILIFILSCESNEAEPDCDLRCVEVIDSTRNYDGSRWTTTWVTANRICDGKRFRWSVGTVDVEEGSIICRDEFAEEEAE
jgi:hypothetical protein